MKTTTIKLTKKQKELLAPLFRAVAKNYAIQRKKHPNLRVGGGMILAQIKSYSGKLEDANAEVMYLRPSRAIVVQKATRETIPFNQSIKPAWLRHDRYNHTLAPAF